MPNHIYSELEVSGSKHELEALLSKVSGDSGYDFNKVYPVPAELQGIKYPVSIVSEEEYAKAASALPDPSGFNPGLPLTAKMADNYTLMFGANNWYDWSLKNYGTKWGIYNAEALSFDVSEGVIKFSYQTAWSPAGEFFKRASLLFSSLVFKTEFADEGGGFVGTESYCNGCVVRSKEYEWRSPEGIAIQKKVGCYYEDEEEVYEPEPEPVFEPIPEQFQSDNPYVVLGVKKGTSKADIKKAFYSLIKKHHPDTGGNPVIAMRIVLAYQDIGQ